MMQLNEFAEEVLAGVREKADGDFSAWTTTIHKNNGTSFVGITISGTENQAQPIVYLDGYYNMFLHSKISLKEVSLYKDDSKPQGHEDRLLTQNFHD